MSLLQQQNTMASQPKKTVNDNALAERLSLSYI